MKKPHDKLRAAALMVAVLAGVVAIVPSGPAQARHGLTHRWTGGAVTYKQATTNPIAQSTQSQTFVAVPGLSLTVPIGPNRTALVSVRYTGESACTGPTARAWCSIRILIGGVIGEPNLGDGSDYAFAAVQNPDGLWEGHALERHLCVRNANTTSTRLVTVVAQWRTVGAVGTTFGLDDSSLVAERSASCSPIDLTLS